MRKAFFFFFLAFLPLFGKELTWLEDIQAVKAKAQAEKKPVFMLFTGSDWCTWCKKLETQILSKDGFIDPLMNEFVFMKVDFPLSLPQDEATKKQNVELRQQFAVEGFPTIIILDSDFYPIQVLGYQDITPEDFAGIVRENVTEYKETMKQMNAVFEKNATSQISPEELKNLYQKIREFRRNDLKNRLIDLGLQQEDNLFFLLEKYQVLAEENKLDTSEGKAIKTRILSKDGENKLGSVFRTALIEFQDKLDGAKGKPEKIEASVSPLKEYARNFGKVDPQNGWRINLMISQILSSVQNHKEALEYAKTAQETAPEEMKRQVEETIKSIEKNL